MVTDAEQNYEKLYHEAVQEAARLHGENSLLKEDLLSTHDALEVMRDRYTTEINTAAQAQGTVKRLQRQITQLQDLNSDMSRTIAKRTVKAELQGTAAPIGLTPNVQLPPEPISVETPQEPINE